MLYFAYGSNMNLEQIRWRCPSARFVCIGSLPGYRFGIAHHSRLRRCGTANILADTESTVWGIVYAITDEDFEILDRFEDGYRREEVTVHPSNNGNEPLRAIVYIAPQENETPLPNPEYKRLMLEAAKHWNMPVAYIEMLETIDVA